MLTESLATPIKVRYSEHVDFPSQPLPIVRISISSNSSLSSYYPVAALVDSGASKSVISPLVAKLLGADLDKCRPVGGLGVGGRYKGYFLPEPLRVDIFGYEFDFSFLCIEGMTWACILGGDSIFQVAKIEFQRFKGFFELRFRNDIN